MHPFDILGDPVRRRIVDFVAGGARSAGDIGAVVEAEFKISQPAVSQHLRVLRANGFVTVRAEGTRRLYALNPAPLREVADWVDRYREYWTDNFDSLDDHLARMQGRPVPKRRPSDGTSIPTSSRASRVRHPASTFGIASVAAAVSATGAPKGSTQKKKSTTSATGATNTKSTKSTVNRPRRRAADKKKRKSS